MCIRDSLGVANLSVPSRVWDGGRDWVLVNELGDDDIPRFVRYRVGR